MEGRKGEYPRCGFIYYSKTLTFFLLGSASWVITLVFHRAVLENVKGKDVKLFGTPFVTYVNNAEPLSGADIDAIISGFLSPLHRAQASSKIQNGVENGHLPDAAADETSGSISSPDTEIDDASDRELSFRIFLTDERGLNFKPLHSESSVSTGTVTRVLVEWNETEHGKYDSSYLSDLPEVHKTSFSAKKTRQEAISLFSCLEAFLAEEPLGPDDMWYSILSLNLLSHKLIYFGRFKP